MEWPKSIKTWKIGNTLYISVVFTWHLEEAMAIAEEWKGDVKIGGPALMEPTECREIEPILFHNPLATFTTRGCPNKCGFCAVPKIEGDFREIKDFRPAPFICDNNFLASSTNHIKRVVDKAKVFPYIDFNQGLDARLFTKEKAEILGNLKCKVRFAFDSWGMESKVKEAIDLCRRYTTKDIGVYCLIGYNDTPEDALERLNLIRSWGIRPNPMRFQPLDAKVKDEYIKEGWDRRFMQRVMRYYSRLIYVEHIPFEEFEDDPNQVLLFE